MDRIQIKDVKNYAGQEVLVKGFAENWRDGKSMAFLVLKDITGKVQVTIEKELHPDWADELAKITLDSVVFVTGTVQLSDFVKLNGVEITPEMINCAGCRIDGVKTPFCDSLCPIRQCALSKDIETCGDCSEMSTCEKLEMITGNNEEALKRLKG